MSGGNLVSWLLGIMLALVISLFIYLVKEPMFQTTLSTTRTIPATEWKCEVNAETKEIICKGVMK